MSKNLKFFVRPKPVDRGKKPFNDSTNSPRTALQHKAVLFDMDGTLHKEDAFTAFIFFILKKRWCLAVLFLPLLIFGLMIYALFPKHKLGINIILAVLLMGLTKKRLNDFITTFCQTFKKTHTPFTLIQEQLAHYLNSGHQVFIITGTPILIAQTLYCINDLNQDKKLHFIGSVLANYSHFYYLKDRCFSDNKVILLNTYLKEHQLNCQFVAGFSDSQNDQPIMTLCRVQYWVDKNGQFDAHSPHP